MRGDTQVAAERAKTFLTDPRAEHYWDLWKFASRTYTHQLGVPELEAWDMFVFYKPYITWGQAPPSPTFWMQARGLAVGEKYTKEDLEARLTDWLQ